MYSGGSGGFLLLHLLLLSNEYFAHFAKFQSTDQLVSHQWNIVSGHTWKNTEIWPNNAQTGASNTALNKIYFYCNPQNCIINFSHINLCLYTDFDSQNKLAYYKKANWYHWTTQKYQNSKIQAMRQALTNWQNDYSSIKGHDWPVCKSFKKIKTLPEYIQNEVMEKLNLSSYYNIESNDDLAWYKSDKVYKPILPYLQNADIQIKLQDLVNSNAEVLISLLNLQNINDKQQALLTKWRNLHPPKLLQSIGIMP
jgi:hypothetical protein